MTAATAAAVTAAAARKFDSASLAETARWGREGRGVMRASEPEEKTAMAEVRKVRAEKTETEKTEAEKMRADKTADSSEKGQRRCRNLSDVSVRSSRKGRTQQGKKITLRCSGTEPTSRQLRSVNNGCFSLLSRVTQRLQIYSELSFISNHFSLHRTHSSCCS